jgi:hypothetical protein
MYTFFIKLLALSLEKQAIECLEKRSYEKIHGRLWGELAEKYMGLSDDLVESLKIRKSSLSDKIE